MSTETLTSLAILKVHVDQGNDYLDYLCPFILQVLAAYKPDPVTDAVVRVYIRDDFGLEIPERAIQVVLKRLSRNYPLTRDHGIYRINGNLPRGGIDTKKAEAERHIRAVVAGLKEFSKDTARPIASREEAIQAICAFLTEFNILCLRAYLRGTAIPGVAKHDNAIIVLVSEYVLSLQETDPECFNSFQVVVTGHMLANALLCPDLQQAPKTYKGVTLYFDTPLLVRQFGLEGRAKQAAIEDLIVLLRNLGAKVAAFSHSRDELERVIRAASEYIDSPEGRGEIVMEARKARTTKSDLLVIAGQINDKLAEANIEVERTPRYVKDFQIDESAFEGVLDDEVTYHNPRAKEDDINSVRSIYVLRSGTAPRSVENAKAVLVTSNSGFAQAAFEFGKDHEESREVSSVITDFSLANMAWLKAPLGAPSLPMTEVLAFSYAALKPSKELLEKYLFEIDKLERQGKIKPRDHQLLRSSHLAQAELMNLTLGEENALTEQTVTETLKRVEEEIKKEESQRYKSEQVAHLKTQEQLTEQRNATKRVQERLYWRCRSRASICAWISSTIIVALIISGLAAGIGFRSNNAIVGWTLIAGSGSLILLTLCNLIFGTTVKRFQKEVQTRCLTCFIRRKAKETGLDLID